MSKRIDLTGAVYGAWTVLSYFGCNKNRQPSWNCRCSCGVERVVVGQTLRNGLTNSCGCELASRVSTAKIKHGQSRRHGQKETRTYSIWCAMHGRCNGTTDLGRKYYVARGIKVCDRWSNFENFLADMGEAPDGLSIDRFPDNDGNYEPGNCRWATRKQQMENSRPKDPSLPPRARDELGRYA